MASKLQIDIITDARGVARGVSQAEGHLGKLGSIGKKVGLAAAAGLAVAGAAAVKFGLDSVSSASEVQQSFGALESIYGKNADQVKRWAESAADDVGLAKSEYANLSALVGAQLKGMGYESDKAANKSNDLVKVGADLAATFGGSVSDAVGAVSSLLKGERDPIERYGVSIKAADVEAQKAAMGLDGLTGAAAKQADAQATLALLMDQTAHAQGQFARESDTLAGQQERLGAKFENLKATIGEYLMPVATQLVTWASEKMLPAAERLGVALGEKLGPIITVVGEFITENLLPAGRRLVEWINDRIVPGLRDYLAPILESVRTGIAHVTEELEENRPAFEKVAGVIGEVVGWVAEHLYPWLGKLIGFLAGAFFKEIGRTIDRFGTLVGWIEDGVNAVRDLIDWFGKLKVPDIDLTPWDGWLPGFSSGPLAYGSAPSGYGTAALAGPTGGWGGFFADAREARAAATVDARTYLSVTVDGSGIVDEHALAQRIAELLARWAHRLGRPVTELLAGAR